MDEASLLSGDRRLGHFAGSDYLRLAWHPAVRRAAGQALKEYPTSAGASRSTTGNLPLYGQLEKALATFFGVGAATVTSAGYTAPLVVGQALAADHGVVLLDAGAHACLRDAAVLTGLKVLTFAHRDPTDLERLVRRLKADVRALVLTNGLNPVDGRVAPLAEYLAALDDRGTLVVDDAHGVGVLGESGRGSVEWSGVSFRRVVVTMTLSKAFGAYGGVILGDPKLRRRILDRSRLFTGNTPPPPPSVAAALASISVLEKEGGALRHRLGTNVARIRPEIRGGDSGPPGPGPMFAIAPGSARAVEQLRRNLLEAGIYPPLIRYPNGPAAQYFRFAVSSGHSARQMQNLAEVLEQAWASHRPRHAGVGSPAIRDGARGPRRTMRSREGEVGA